jgi:outer membrane receptor protein involved in Fe transport
MTVALVASFSSPAFSQQDPQPTQSAESSSVEQTGKPGQQGSDPVVLPEVVVIASGAFEQELFYLPWSAAVIKRQELRDTARTFSEALTGLPSVMVQKTAYGQSSPYIRGLTGYHNMLLVDGIRLNNSAMRAGPNQYWSTVDMLSLSRVELLRGPQAVLYGSQAIGGVVQALGAPAIFSEPDASGDPNAKEFNPNNAWFGSGGMYSRWSSAESSYTLRFEGEMHNNDWSLRVGQTLQSFGDLRGGKDVGLQKNTGYDAYATDIYLDRRLAGDVLLSFGVQNVKQNDVPRTHKTVDGLDWRGLKPGSELYRLQDQTRRLYFARVSWDHAGGWADSAQITLSLHDQSETRNRMKGNPDGTPKGGDFQGLGVSDLGLNARFEADGNWNDRWSYGIEIHRESADSFKRKFDANGVTTSTEIQGPIAADATYTTIEAYVQDEIFLSDTWSLIPGVRFSRIDVDVDRVQDPVTGLATAFSRDYQSAVGSLRALWQPNPDNVWFAGVSQGFRAPSLYDLTSLDETSVIETPDFDLESENFLQAEIGGRGRTGGWDWEASLYRTWISDMIVRSPENTTGSDVLKSNGDGWINGFESRISYRWNDSIDTELWTSWMDGEVEQRLPGPGFAQVDRPLDRLMPLQARLSTRYQKPISDWWAEAYIWAMDGQSKLSLRDERDTGRIPDTNGDGFSDGTPGFAILGIRTGWDLNPGARLTVALENLGNVDYRVHGSGINGAGLNLIVGLNLRF